MKYSLCLIITLSFTSWCSLSSAEPAQDKGLQIVKQSKALNRGWVDGEAEMEMHLFDKEGNKNIRSLRMKMKEVEGDGDKKLSIFDQPRDIKGTRFLSLSHALVPDEQWIFLPAIKRVKRIASRNKSGPFLGSEFAYEDIGSSEIAKYKYNYLKQEPCGELSCHIIEFEPQYESSGYSKMIVWLDTKDLQQRKIDYYDRKGSLLKTLGFREYKQYLNKYWQAGIKEMVNHQTKNRTLLITLKYALGLGLDDSLFSHRGLKRRF
jgi:outer membrane lipoprotein-sorting protein